MERKNGIILERNMDGVFELKIKSEPSSISCQDRNFLRWPLFLAKKQQASFCKVIFLLRLINELSNAKKYAEGRGIRIDVRNEEIISDIQKLVEIKLSN